MDLLWVAWLFATFEPHVRFEGTGEPAEMLEVSGMIWGDYGGFGAVKRRNLLFGLGGWGFWVGCY